MVIIPDAFTTGFEEHMSTFSQEVRALNPVRIVVMEIHVAGLIVGYVSLECFGWSHQKGIYGLSSHYILCLHY